MKILESRNNNNEKLYKVLCLYKYKNSIYLNTDLKNIKNIRPKWT